MNEDDQIADVLVVGCGMCGSAAARHLKESRPGLTIWLVGPEEAVARETDAFSQHADEGRITRRLDSNPVWAALAARSIDRYAGLEASSGICFHRPVGFVAVGHRDGPYIKGVAKVADAHGLPLRGPLDKAVLECEFPYLNVGDENVALIEEGMQSGAGLISPRALVRAQCLLFELGGGRIFHDVVERLDLEGGGSGEETQLVKATLRTGRTLRARRALVCIGALARWKPLLPSSRGHLRPATQVVTQEVVRVAVAAEDLSTMQRMPCMVFKFGSAAFGTASTFDSCYVLPPLPYQDGAGETGAEVHYLKLGHGTWFEVALPTPEAASAWMRGEAGANVRDGMAAAEALKGKLDELFPGLRARSPKVVVDRCMWDTTANMHPYIDMLPGGYVGLIAGGNGFAAKSSDEIGRVAALMMLGAIDGTGWSYDIPKEAFAASFEPYDVRELDGGCERKLP